MVMDRRLRRRIRKLEERDRQQRHFEIMREWYGEDGLERRRQEARRAKWIAWLYFLFCLVLAVVVTRLWFR